jgi:hypothetical protein
VFCSGASINFIIGDLEMFKAISQLLEKEGKSRRDFFSAACYSPSGFRPKNQSSKGRVPYWLRPFQGLTYPTNEPRPRESFPYQITHTFSGTPPNLIGVLRGGGIWQKKVPVAAKWDRDAHFWATVAK